MTKNVDILQIAEAVLKTESAAINDQLQHLDANFQQACHTILDCEGRVIIMGMGKSGLIGRKIAATLASTGTPAFFVHPAEAGHGDLGMVKATDVVILISYSGESPELLNIIPGLKQFNCKLISLCGRKKSSLTAAADINVDVSISEEACPLGLAPTASTTASLAIGDAIAIACQQERGFSEHDFARRHPSGALGKRLLLHVSDIMHTGDSIPCVASSANLEQTILEMTKKGLGLTLITENELLVGIFTDGDLRRSLQHADWQNKNIGAIMSPMPITIAEDMLAAEALQLMEDKKITSLIIAKNNKVNGIVHIHDILNSGI